MSRTARNVSAGDKTIVPGVGTYNLDNQYSMRTNSCRNKREVPKSI